MKTTLLFASLVISASLSAQATRTTVNAGNATNPLTWDCMCVPAPGDNIVVNHALNLDVDYAYASGSVTINSSGSVTGSVPQRIFGIGGGSFTNNGALNVGYLYYSAGTFNSSGTMTIGASMGVDSIGVANISGNLIVGDTLYVNTLATANLTGTSNVSNIAVIANAGTIQNAHALTIGELWNSGTFTHGSNQANITGFVLNAGTLNLNWYFMVNGDFFNNENVNLSHHLSVANFYNGDSIQLPCTFTNNGTVSVTTDFLNSKDITGTGKFCVGQSSTNSGSITGTIDFCDVTGGNIDVNIGTVSGTVTYCSIPCTVGMEETVLGIYSVYPNPAADVFTISFANQGEHYYRITDVMGRVIAEGTSMSNTLQVDATSWPAGVYFLSVEENGVQHSDRIVVE